MTRPLLLTAVTLATLAWLAWPGAMPGPPTASRVAAVPPAVARDRSVGAPSRMQLPAAMAPGIAPDPLLTARIEDARLEQDAKLEGGVEGATDDRPRDLAPEPAQVPGPPQHLPVPPLPAPVVNAGPFDGPVRPAKPEGAADDEGG